MRKKKTMSPLRLSTPAIRRRAYLHASPIEELGQRESENRFADQIARLQTFKFGDGIEGDS